MLHRRAKIHITHHLMIALASEVRPGDQVDRVVGGATITDVIDPTSGAGTITARFNGPGQLEHTWKCDEYVEVWRKESTDKVFRIVHASADLDRPRTVSIAKLTKAVAEREFARLATGTRYHAHSGRRLAVMAVSECEHLGISK